MGFLKKQSKDEGRKARTPHSSKSTYSYSSRRSVRTEPLNRQPENGETSDKPSRMSIPLFQHLPLLIGVIVAFCGVVYLSILSSGVVIKLKQDTLLLRSTEEYSSKASEFLANSIINRSKLLIDSEGLSAYLKQEFPELAAVTVTIPVFGRQPIIKIQTTQPSFMLKSGGKTYLVGVNGVALISLDTIKDSSKLNLLTVNDESGVALESGKAVLPKDQAMFIAVIIEQLEKQNRAVESLTIPASPYDLHAKLKDSPYKIKFNIMDEPKQQVGSLITLQDRLASQGIVPSEYIDVRAGERVFYK